MGINHIRPLDAECGQGLCLGARPPATPSPRPVPESTVLGSGEDTGLGSGETAGQEGSCQSGAISRPVCELCVHSSQEGRVTEAGGEPKTPEQSCVKATFQDGGGPYAQGPSEKGGLDDVYRFEGCVHVGPVPPPTQEVALFPVEGSTVRIPVSTVRSQQRPQGLHEDLEACHGSVEETGDTVHHLHRRPTPSIAVQGGVGRDHKGGSRPSPPTGLCHKLGEVNPATLPDNPVSGVCGRFEEVLDPPRGQADANSEGLFADAPNAIIVTPLPGPSDRQDGSDIPGHSPSTFNI